MRLHNYLLSGSTLFDAEATFPLWLTSDIQHTVEEIALYDYGMRKIRPYFEHLTKHEREGITPTLETVIQWAVESFIARNDYKYKTLFETEDFEYDPIVNYDMVETMDETTDVNYGRTDTRTLEKDTSDIRTLNYSDNRTVDLSETRTPNTTETHTLNNLTSTETNQIEGFNSSSFVDSDKKTSVGTGSETTAETGSETTTNDGTDNVEHTGTDTMAHSGTDTDTNRATGKDTTDRDYTLTRKGNIGVMTTQNLVTEQRKVADFSAVSMLTHDLINAITIGVY